MNLGELDLHCVHHKRPQLQRIITSQLPVAPLNVQIHDDRTPSLPSSTSEATTVIRWITPPSQFPTPQRSLETIKPNPIKHSIGANEVAYVSSPPLVVRFDEEQIRSTEVDTSKRGGRMEDVDLDSCPPTPGTDDTPYIRFAIDQLTRDEETRATQRSSAGTSSDSYSVQRMVPDLGLGYLSPAIHTREDLALARKYRSSPGPERLFRFNATRPLSYDSADLNGADEPDIFIPVDPPHNTPRYPDLTFVPTILRPLSMITLSILCILMIAAIAFCAVYSTYHNGLLGWYEGIYGGRYFIFGFLPQLLAACIFIYVQEVMSAVRRILPYTLLAMDDAERRAHAMFLGLYPRSVLWPRVNSPIGVDIASLFYWLSPLMIPLQSCLFSVIPVGGTWRWTAVQGVAWTLVALYALVLIGTVIAGSFFFRRRTGLMWDPRSLADIISLLPRSNALKDYPGTDVMGSKREIQNRLAFRSDRLGYWRTHNSTQGVFYSIGEEGLSIQQYTLEGGKIQKKLSAGHPYGSMDIERATVSYSTGIRFRYIPWYIRDTFIIFWSVAAFLLLLALAIISFLPSTAIRNGFDPLVSAEPNSQGFSPANFLYSFIPSILGLTLYLLFQPLDMTLRQLQPWAELGKQHGATADKSLLLDYTAALPFECTLSAFHAGHYRVAIISLLSFLFILLPVLAGGLFFPLTTLSDEVRMIPNLPSLYVLLAILVLYLLAILILIPNRRLMHLPHDVGCLAEICSFVYNSRILDDAAFHAPRTKADLVTRLISVPIGGREARYQFGVHRGRDGKDCMGIDKLDRRDPRLGAR